MKVILFVDDERLILRELKRVFDDQDYTYIYKKSAEEAIVYIQENHVDILCTDIYMPKMDGFELLRRVKDRFPSITRIALSSFNKKSQIKQLMNEGLAQLYLFKPWDDNELKMNIYKLFNLRNALYSNEMLQLIDQLKSLPTLPEIYDKLTTMVADDEPIEDIAKLIEEDQSITSVILRVANSAFYGRKTGDIPQAIMNIGLENLKSIVLANAVFQEMSDDMDILGEMWQHATLTNKIVTAIYSQCLNKPIPSIFASAGLLHDIGKLVLYHTFGNYKELLRKSRAEKTSLCDMEYDMFGVSHQDLGGYLLNWWALPFAYVEAAMFHHRPFDYRIINKELVSVMHISHYYAERAYKDHDDIELDEKAFVVLNKDREAFEKMLGDTLDWRPYE